MRITAAAGITADLIVGRLVLFLADRFLPRLRLPDISGGVL